MPGHPDGQNYAIWRGTDFFANTAFPISSTNPVNAQGQVTNFASLVINLNGTLGGGNNVIVQWYTDQTATVLLLSQNWIVPSGALLNVMLPIAGNFVKVQITTPIVAATNTAVSIYPTNTQANKPTYFGSAMIIGTTSVTVPISGSVPAPFPSIAAGRYHLFCRDINSSGKLSFVVNTQNEDSTLNFGVKSVLAPVTQADFDFVSDAVPLILTVSNSDAAASHNAAYVFECVPG